MDLAPASQKHNPIVLFTGRFGSGKTEAAINYALMLAKSKGDGKQERAATSVILIDLDIVTPYFRSREMSTGRAMEERGVRVVAPNVVGQHLDIPAITPQILGAFQQTEQPVVVDVGGDPQGACQDGGMRGAAADIGDKRGNDDLALALHILAEGMPEGMTATSIAEAMKKVSGVSQVHDLHVWTVAPGYIALSAHVTITDRALSQAAELMGALKTMLHDRFEIHHTTVQLECENCGQGQATCAQS